MSGRTRPGAALAIALTLLLCGCGSSSTTLTETVYTTPAPPKPHTQAGTAGGSVAYRKPWYQGGLRSLGFQSPTGNIRCALQSTDRRQLLCTTLNNGNAIDLGSSVQGDTNITATIPIEPTVLYGHSWSSPNFYCWSKFTGVTCRSLYSTYGFEIDRDGITQLEWAARILTPGPRNPSNRYSLYGAGTTSPVPSDSAGAGADFCSTHDCIGDWSDPSGSVVQCNDGSWSHSGGESGACSWHGGER
jgi:hypothetical protein